LTIEAVDQRERLGYRGWNLEGGFAMRAFRISLWLAAAAVPIFAESQVGAAAEDAQDLSVISIGREAIPVRTKALVEKAPKGARLIAYLDCGADRESSGAGPVKIVCTSGKPHHFPSEAPGVPATQATVFFDTGEVVFEIRGLESSRRYQLGLSWWDYDNSGRTQSIVVTSPDGRLVRLAVPAIRLPDYKDSRLLPAERRFQLPVTFAQDGKLRLVVQQVAGANAVISELWIYQLD